MPAYGYLATPPAAQRRRPLPTDPSARSQARRLYGEETESQVGQAHRDQPAFGRVQVAPRCGKRPGTHARYRAGSWRDLRCIVAAISVAVVAASMLTIIEIPAAVRAQAASPSPNGVSKATVAEALAEAKRSNRPVTVGSMVSESRTVEVTPSGSFISTEHLRPVRARSAGGWVPIDTTLVGKDGGYGPKASTIGLRISGGGAGPLVSMTRAGRTVSFGWPGTLPKPMIQGDRAIFASVMKDVDLMVQAEADGFRHVLRVKTPEAAADPRVAKLTLELQAPGVRLEQDASGVLRAVDTAGGGVMFEAPRPVMWDSSGRKAHAGVAGSGVAPIADPLAGPLDGSKVADVTVIMESGKLSLVPDKGLLTGSDTVFPVYVDPKWETVTQSAWAMVSSSFPNESYWKFDGKSTEGVGFCNFSLDGDCGRDQTKRVLFKVPTSAYIGKHIMSATFFAYNTHSFDCSTNRSVELWRVKSFDSSTTWNNDDWLRQITSRSVSYCGGSEAPVEFGGATLRDEVQSVADAKYSTMSFGLRAGNESTMLSWKRFADKAALQVQFNLRPPQPLMENLTSNPGASCSGPTEPDYVSTLPTLRAWLINNDSDEKLFAQFGVGWDHDGDGTVTQQWTSDPPEPGSQAGYKTPPNSFNLTVIPTLPRPDGSTIVVPERKLLYWKVRVYDGTEWSPWSTDGNQTGCYFIWDSTTPAAPTISSTDYPESNPNDSNDPWYPGVGRYGTFTSTSTASVAKVWFGLNGDPVQANERVPDSSGRASIQLAPERAGLNWVTVQAFALTGKPSDTRTYYFRVETGSEPVAHWKLDDSTGSTQIADETGNYPGTVHGGVTLEVPGMDRTAMQVNGENGYAATATKVIDTSQSFAVSAWARLSNPKPNHAAIIMTQAGTNTGGFELYYSSVSDKWVFNRYSTDSATAPIVRAMSTSSPVGGEWTHLTGVFDAVAKTIRLYVNGGDDKATTPFEHTPWKAEGPVQLGAGWYNGTQGSYFNGDIDDVRVYNRIVTSDEARTISAQHPTVVGRWRLNDAAVTLPNPTAHYRLDEAAGATGAADAVGLYPAPAYGVDFGQAGKVGKAAYFNGTSDYAATTRKVLDTTKSFSVAAWAKLADPKPTQAAIIATQAGLNRSGFELYYSSTFDRWIFNRYDADNSAANIVRAQSQNPPGSGWTHLVGVYDAEQGEIRLYVGGVLQGSTPYTNPWSANGSLQLGAGWYGNRDKYFKGHIDDVRVYSQALTGSEAAYLAQSMPGGVSADESTSGHLLHLRNQAWVDPNAGWIVNPPGGALVLDGVDDYADTASRVVTTNRSFTVMAWVNTAGAPTRNAAVISQAGSVNSGFTVRYTPPTESTSGGYQIEIPDKDGSTAVRQAALHTAFDSNGTTWDHVAVVYDASLAKVTLYVNGQFEDSENLSYRFNTIGFDATGPLQIGRTLVAGTWGEYWPGVIDDVWAFRGVLDEDQIRKLMGAECPVDLSC